MPLQGHTTSARLLIPLNSPIKAPATLQQDQGEYLVLAIDITGLLNQFPRAIG